VSVSAHQQAEIAIRDALLVLQTYLPGAEEVDEARAALDVLVAALHEAERQRNGFEQLAASRMAEIERINVRWTKAMEIEKRSQELEAALRRAAFVAKHLIEFSDEFTGVTSPDGHKEDDAIRESLHREAEGWASLADRSALSGLPDGTKDTASTSQVHELETCADETCLVCGFDPFTFEPPPDGTHPMPSSRGDAETFEARVLHEAERGRVLGDEPSSSVAEADERASYYRETLRGVMASRGEARAQRDAAVAETTRLAALLEACVKTGFSEVVGYTSCRGCAHAREMTGVWWSSEAELMTHDEDCPLYPFAAAREALRPHQPDRTSILETNETFVSAEASEPPTDDPWKARCGWLNPDDCSRDDCPWPWICKAADEKADAIRQEDHLGDE
jgi:hypothetical protein